MSKKVDKEEFLRRFYDSYPEQKIEVIEYTAISKPAIIKCCYCGKEHYKKVASNFLKSFKCCKESGLTKYERLIAIYEESEDFELVRKIDKDNVIIHHNLCKNDIKRNIQSCLQSPFACKYCETHKQANMLSIDEVQRRIDDEFYGTIKLLTYNGQLEKNDYKCLKCGLIFKTDQISLMASRGCPSCNRWKSKGEVFIAHYLEEKGINFEEQVKVPELGTQKFDFGIYKDGKIECFIEVQGEQHFEKREIFRDSLEVIQARDERKRAYCKEHNIPLYELIYKKGKFLNLDILPF